MKVYRYSPNGDAFNQLRMLSTERWGFGRTLIGRRLAQEWTPLEVEIEKRKKKPDFYDLFLVPVFNRRALEVFQPLLSGRIEALPLAIKDSNEQLYLIHVLDILDCFDYARATYEAEEGLPPRITTYRFKSRCIGDRLLFRLHETWSAEVLITDAFAKVVAENNLKGLIIKPSTLLDDVD